jgi:glycosyltransferase involved in cell wall biosynthesis
VQGHEPVDLVAEHLYPNRMLLVHGEDLHGVTPDPERAALENLARALGLKSKVEFLGHVRDAGALCGEFDVLAVPSTRESFGLAALEAMGCGVPVVATRVGGLPELIIDGETGILVPPDDELSMAAAIIKLLGDRALKERMGEAGRARAAENFNEKKMHSAWIELSSSR